jgi:serine/threonine protein kinase
MMDVSPDEEVFHFQFEADPCLYDSGKKISVAYRRNKNEVDCVENTILDYKPEPMRKEMGALDALLQVYPDFPTRATSFYDTATRITIETIGGKLTATITEDLDAIIPYPPIPSSLSHVPTVSITEIQRMRAVYMDVDCVKWRGSTYAFKQTGEEVEGTLRELVILDRLAKSPNIINVAAIVVNHDNAIRGFLTPFMCTGDLESVFEKARQSIGLGDNDDATAFEWPLKLSWARQIAQAVVELHAISAYNGDLKPQNILISPTGRALLIDFLPRGISDDFAAPELVEMSHSHGIPFELVVSAPADVYSLGLVLWAVAEERWGGIRTPVWRDGKTPDWYRDIVKRCLVLAPEARPSAIEVLSLLERERA